MIYTVLTMNRFLVGTHFVRDSLLMIVQHHARILDDGNSHQPNSVDKHGPCFHHSVQDVCVLMCDRRGLLLSTVHEVVILVKQ